MAAVELVFSVPLELLRTEETNSIHDNDAVLGLLQIYYLPVNDMT